MCCRSQESSPASPSGRSVETSTSLVERNVSMHLATPQGSEVWLSTTKVI